MRVLHKHFDWTYSTSYAGTYEKVHACEPHAVGLDYDLLRRPEPILMYGEAVLFEDELGDNGTSQCGVRVRVMRSGAFVLLRFVLRVDGVLYRVRDTRVQLIFDEDVDVKLDGMSGNVDVDVDKVSGKVVVDGKVDADGDADDKVGKTAPVVLRETRWMEAPWSELSDRVDDFTEVERVLPLLRVVKLENHVIKCKV